MRPSLIRAIHKAVSEVAPMERLPRIRVAQIASEIADDLAMLDRAYDRPGIALRLRLMSVRHNGTA